MKSTILVFAAFSLFSLLAPTGCEQITQQNKDRENARIQRERNAQAAAAKAHEREIAYKEGQARAERELREKLVRVSHDFWAPIWTLGLVMLALVGLIIQIIRSYSRNVVELAQIHANKETRKLIVEHWPELSEEQGIAFVQSIAPPSHQLPAPENSPPQLPPAPDTSPQEKAVRLNNGTKPAVE